MLLRKGTSLYNVLERDVRVRPFVRKDQVGRNIACRDNRTARLPSLHQMHCECIRRESH